jgi:hypothetical protein
MHRGSLKKTSDEKTGNPEETQRGSFKRPPMDKEAITTKV